MEKNNFQRMMKVIDEVFAVRQDADQLQMNEAQRKKLAALHSSTMMELADENGPLIWVLLIPTTEVIMEQFLKSQISEKVLLEKTPLNSKYECIYLCSASTLPEMRNKGKTRQLCLEGISNICKDHPIKTLFVWPFTGEGLRLAKSVSKTSGLVLKMKEKS